jgi:hypothetical protein
VPRLQAITQQHFQERQMTPMTSKMIEGGTGGVPKMHPLKSSMPSLKAGSLIHGLRLRAPRAMRMPRMGMG